MTSASSCRARWHAHRAFSLLEVLIASTLTLVLVALALEFAATMSLEARRLEQRGDLAGRASIASRFLHATTDSIGYGWSVRQSIGGTDQSTGTFGLANCAVPSVCPTATTLPLQICEPATIGQATCAPHSAPARTPDALRFFVPRDGIVEAVRIVDRTGASLPTDCTIASATTFDVRGVNASSWRAGDLALVARRGHVSIVSVAAAFPAGLDPSVTRRLTLLLGNPAALAGDDGGVSAPCSARTSLQGAGLYRLRLAAIRVHPPTRTLEYATLDNTADAFAFVPILDDVDDLQVRLDLIRYGVVGGVIDAAAACFADTEAALATASGIPSCGSVRLNALSRDGDIVRLIGLRIAVLLRSRGGVDVQRPVRGLFDRTDTLAVDGRLRRAVHVFVGLPNALL